MSPNPRHRAANNLRSKILEVFDRRIRAFAEKRERYEDELREILRSLVENYGPTVYEILGSRTVIDLRAPKARKRLARSPRAKREKPPQTRYRDIVPLLPEIVEKVRRSDGTFFYKDVAAELNRRAINFHSSWITLGLINGLAGVHVKEKIIGPNGRPRNTYVATDPVEVRRKVTP